MEDQSNVAVSLDELTLDIASEDLGHPCEKDFFDAPVHPEEEIVNADNQFKITIANDFNPDHDLTVQTGDFEIDDENGQAIITEGDVNLEIIGKSHPGSLNELEAQTISEPSKPISDTDFDSDVADFEVDDNPLSLFPRKIEDDDEDSEFEFPEPDTGLSQQNKPNAVAATGAKGVHFSDALKDVTHEDTTIDSRHEENLEPEILTPRHKVTSDLTDILHEVKMRTTEEIKSESRNFIKDSSTTDTDAIAGEESSTDHVTKAIKSMPDIVTTAEDWDQVQVVVPGFAADNKSKSGAAPPVESKPLARFTESWSELAEMDYDDVKGQIKTRTDRKGFSALSHFLFGPPKLHKSLVPERDLVFSMAATKFNNESEVHNRVLQTVYRCLTGSKFDCQRYGSHWEEIGFQGQDPATDLRGGGVLSLLHILYFLQDPSTKELARDVYKLSLHPTQNFPFCVMSINITVMCLRVVRDDVYNREFNKRKDVVSTMNNLYAALFLNLYLLWKKGKTIRDSGYVLEEVANYSRKNSKNIFKDLESYEKMKKEQSIFGDHPSENALFFNICKQEKCDDKTAAELY